MGPAARPGGRAGRRRPRAADPGTWRSPPTGSTASRGVATSTRSRCSVCSAAPPTADGTRHDHGFALYTIVIGDQCPQAVGYAMGMQHDGAENAVMVFFGDGASSQGDVNESFIWASVFNAPVVFFCQNNQWAISEPLERQTRIPLFQRAWGFGFPGIRVDGNDVLACLAVSQAHAAACPRRRGPSLIEAFTYRMGAHTTSDDPTRYRLDSDVEAWRLRDPLERVRSYLHKQQLVDDDVLRRAGRRGRGAGRAAARRRPGASRSGAGGRCSTHAYAEPHSLVERQRDAVHRLPGRRSLPSRPSRRRDGRDADDGEGAQRRAASRRWRTTPRRS